MYEAFFKLQSKPFELVPNPDFMYLSRSHRKAMTFIDYGIRERAGFILLTGDVGSGKTTLIRNLISKHYERVVLAKVFNTRGTSEQLLAMINDDFGLPVHGLDKVGLFRDLNNFLVEQYAAGNQPILIIDEAQNLSVELLEEVRMLSNLEAADSKLLQIILVGQPELRATLAAPGLLQLRQRISINCHLQPLSSQETVEYILHRLEIAGNRTAVTFAGAALETIHKFSRGIPRLINIICDFLMLAAFVEETTDISAELAQDIVGDLDFENHYWTSATELSPGVKSLNSLPVAPEAASLQPEMMTLLHDISSRLAQFETLAAATGGVYKNLDERIVTLQNAYKYHIGETDAVLADLSRKVEKLRKTIEPNDPAGSDGMEEKAGLIRKIFR